MSDITIFKSEKKSYKLMYCPSKWFIGCRYFDMTITEYEIIFEKCYGVGVSSKSIKMNTYKVIKLPEKNIREFDFPVGKFYFDKEDSNEDKAVIYYK
jgi:hypothetical protein